MKKITKKETGKIFVVWLLVISMILPMFPTGLVVRAEDGDDTPIITSTDSDEMNKTMPTLELERNAELLASVDFHTEGTDGTFTGGIYGDATYSATTIDMTDGTVMDDALTLEEVKSLDKEFTIVFRAQLDEQRAGYKTSTGKVDNIREQGAFALRKSGASKWKDSIFIGVPSREDSDYVYYKYLDGSDTSQTTDKTYAHKLNGQGAATTDGNWHTIAIVQSADTFAYYIDGELCWSKAITVNTSIGDFFADEDAFEAYIGAFATDQNEHACLKGSVDYYQFYKGTLTETQLASLSSTSEVDVIRDDEINRTMPSEIVTENLQVLASVDFGTTKENANGTFFGGMYTSATTSATTIDMTDATVMDDALTLEEVKSLGTEFTIVFRAQLDEQRAGYKISTSKVDNIREQSAFALRKSGASKWKDSIFIGVPSREDSDYVYYKYLDAAGTSQTTDTKTYAHKLSGNGVATTDGNWHTIAIVQSADTFAYYIDGELCWSKAITVNTSIGTFFADETQFEAYIGAFATDQNEHASLKGYMDYYQFYKGALTAEQVATFTNEVDTTVTVVRDDEVNREMPYGIYKTEALATVDFNSTNGTFSGGTYTLDETSATTVDMTDATVMNDALTLREVKNLDKEFTIVFRAKLDDIGARNQAVFALRKSSASEWNDSIFIGAPGSNAKKNNVYDCLYYKYLKDDTSQLSDSGAAYQMSAGASPTLDGAWHTIAIVQEADKIVYYIDGVEKYSNEVFINGTTIGEFFKDETGFQAYIGAFAADQNASQCLQGLMDYYQFYKGALSAEQVATLSSASKTDACETKVVTYTKSQIVEKYRVYDESTDTYTYTAPTMGGYLFAGWYTTKDCTNADNALVGNDIPDVAYALFVPEHILTVKAQISSNLVNDDLKDDSVGSIRFVTSVDSLNYKKVGFYFDIEGGASNFEGANNFVYSKLFAVDPKTGEKGEAMSYGPKAVFCSQSEYFKTFAFYNLSEALYDVKITAKPFWVTLDGTTVYGISETKSINERRTDGWVYMASTGSDENGNGTKAAPYKSLNYALEAVENGAVVCLLDNYVADSTFAWEDHNKDVTITGLTDDVKLDFTAVDDNGTSSNVTLNIWDAVTFSGITLGFQENTRVYANCNRLKVDEDVTSETTIRVYGAGTSANASKMTGGTDVTLLAGNYNVVYGGGDSGCNVDGNTNLYIGKDVNNKITFSAGDTAVQIFGGSFKGNVTGNTKIYVDGNVNNGLDLSGITDSDPAIIYGGSSTSGTVGGNTYITVAGKAKFTRICGGGYSSSATSGQVTEVKGSTNIAIGDDVNQGLPFEESNANNAMVFGGGDGSKNTATVGETNVTITGNANFHAIYGGGRAAGSVVTNDTHVTVSGNVNSELSLTGDGAHQYRAMLYGGSSSGVVGNTHVTVVENAKFNYIYGAGSNTDTATKTTVIIGNENATDSSTEGVKAYGLFGGSYKGTVNNTSLVMYSGIVAQVFGGSSQMPIEGSTNIQLLGGEITRRVYGGCYNDYTDLSEEGSLLPDYDWETSYCVSGNTSVVIGPEMVISLSDTSDDDLGVLATSRYKETFTDERGILIFKDGMYDDNWQNVLGRQDTASKLTLGNPQAYHYLVDATEGGDVYLDDDSLVIVPASTEAELTVTIDGVAASLVNDESGVYTFNLPVISKDEKTTIVVDFGTVSSTREGWLLTALPAYQGDNTLSTSVYNGGTYVTRYGNINRAGTMMQSVSSTSSTEVGEYVDTLKSSGYQVESNTTIESNQFYRLMKDNKRVCVNYYANDEKALVILDSQKGSSIEDASYTYIPQEEEYTEFYMFGLKMDPNGMNISSAENTSGYVNNGECLIIKCADNSVIIVDGGDNSQMSEKDQERFISLLHEITDTTSDDVITISAWYITHFHSDHVSGLSKVFETHSDKFDLERVICNMPDPTTVNRSDDTLFVNTKNAVLDYYPDCKDVKVHTGDVIQLADVTLTVVFCHEDLADNQGVFPTNDFNATSTVVKVETMDGMSMLVTGDLTVDAEEVLCTNFSTETLKCDILQQPHHNFNDNTTIYEYANAKIMLFTQALGGLTKNADMTRRFELAKQWCSEWYCEGNETVGFAYVDEEVKLIYQEENIYD